MVERTEPDEATEAEERAEAGRAHTADRPPTDEESAAADRQFEQSDAEERREVAEHFHEMDEIGAHVKGEGSIE
jgi:hypothetical protein